jgi:hypothetical protein
VLSVSTRTRRDQGRGIVKTGVTSHVIGIVKTGADDGTSHGHRLDALLCWQCRGWYQRVRACDICAALVCTSCRADHHHERATAPP